MFTKKKITEALYYFSSCLPNFKKDFFLYFNLYFDNILTSDPPETLKNFKCI